MEINLTPLQVSRLNKALKQINKAEKKLRTTKQENNDLLMLVLDAHGIDMDQYDVKTTVFKEGKLLIESK
jgi:hypothetical protein